MKHSCYVCKEDFEDHDPNLQACRECQTIINKYINGSKRKIYPPQEVKDALRKAYSHKENDNVYFKCKYTGIVSKFNESNETLSGFKDAFVLTLDHEHPTKNNLVVSLNIINKMKGDIPPSQFREIVISLGDFFKQETCEKIDPRKTQAFERVLREIYLNYYEKEINTCKS
ncbi:hypothetical protein [uncultured Methanomethylovorans sp.]|uniref:hypothetical protein n=1 Tax=uncultured Methanomethylovorans sp. TaxID=183759 RepID=UPI002632B072|nr:hypothetical protein [uncultured Methanomethylovorans sp.]